MSAVTIVEWPPILIRVIIQVERLSEVYCGLKELKGIELRKKSKLPTFCRFGLAQLSSDVSGTRESPPHPPFPAAFSQG